ncbi:MAG: FadR/GntR family transcriptional regulator [Pseudomonadota bacterium]
MQARRALPPDSEEPESGESEPDLPVSAASGSAGIASRLKQAILDGTYPHGSRLPAERELASHFGASRSTVREALRQLEELRLLSRRIGSGTFVNYRPTPDGSAIAEVTSPLQLIEVRLAVEPQIARLAALNATARDLDRLGEALLRIEACGGDQETFSDIDEQFHLLIAECTGNPLMVWLYQQINSVRSHDQWHSMKNQILTPTRIAEYNRHHRRLFEALRSRDVDTSVRMIEQHLDKARQDLLGVNRDRESGG